MWTMPMATMFLFYSYCLINLLHFIFASYFSVFPSSYLLIILKQQNTIRMLCLILFCFSALSLRKLCVQCVLRRRYAESIKKSTTITNVEKSHSSTHTHTHILLTVAFLWDWNTFPCLPFQQRNFCIKTHEHKHVAGAHSLNPHKADKQTSKQTKGNKQQGGTCKRKYPKITIYAPTKEWARTHTHNPTKEQASRR